MKFSTLVKKISENHLLKKVPKFTGSTTILVIKIMTKMCIICWCKKSKHLSTQSSYLFRKTESISVGYLNTSETEHANHSTQKELFYTALIKMK